MKNLAAALVPRERLSLSAIRAVFVTELKHTLRDRRTWFAMVVLPLVLVPVLLIATPSGVEGQLKKIQEEPPAVAVLGDESAAPLRQALGVSGKVRLVEATDADEATAALQEGKLDAVIEVSPNFSSALQAELPGQLTLRYDASRQRSSMVRSLVEALVAEFSRRIVAERLMERDVDPSILYPVETAVVNVAPEEKVAGSFLALIMPMMLAVWAVMGGMYAAIDGVAGEKERGTLEPLLATPPSRLSLVLGKYLTVTLTSVVSAGLAVLGMYLAFVMKPSALMGPDAGETLRFAVPAASALWMVVVALALAAIFSAVQLMISAFARSFREAQSYLSPLSILVVLPAIFTQFVDPSQVSQAIYWVPLINAIFVFKELLVGVIQPNHLAVTLLASALYAWVALRTTVRIFHRESVLFRM